LLSVQVPFLEEWMSLTLLALVFYNAANLVEGRPGLSATTQGTVLGLATLLGTWMLAAVLAPLAWFIACVSLLARLFSPHAGVRNAALCLLSLFLVSAVGRLHQRRVFGEHSYLLGRFVAGSPAVYLRHQLASQQPFPLDCYLQALTGSDERRFENALAVLLVRRLSPAERQALRRAAVAMPSERRSQLEGLL